MSGESTKHWGRRVGIAVLLAWLALVNPAESTADEPMASLRREFARRHAVIPSTSIDERLELASWAERVGLTEEAAGAYHLIVESAPTTEPARQALLRLSDGRRLPLESSARRDARALLPSGRFREYETRRFVVLSDAEPKWALDQAQLLERTHHQLLRFTRQIGIDPLPLRHKLVCVLFASRDDYRRFATNHDDVIDPWIAGYYAPASDRIVFYRGEANPSVVEARVRLAQMRSDLETIGREVSTAQRDGLRRRAQLLADHQDRYRDHFRRETSRVEEFTRQVNIATTVHEAIHQLVFHMAIQTARHPYPVWISEGLATAFETDEPSSAFGPDREYAPRRAGFEEVRQAGDLLPLTSLVTMARVPDDERVVNAIYHQSYALVTWMSRHRRSELRRYLDLMLTEPAGAMSPERMLEIFRAAFGDERQLERTWLRSERN